MELDQAPEYAIVRAPTPLRYPPLLPPLILFFPLIPFTPPLIPLSPPPSYPHQVLVGPVSDVFRRHGVAPEDGATCFSLVVSSDDGRGRTLDLRARSADEVTVWTAYFRQVRDCV